MKAWRVSDADSHVYCFVFGESRTEAKKSAIKLDESDSLGDGLWIEIGARRVPEYDDVAITEARLMQDERMGWTVCLGCRQDIHSPEHPDREGHTGPAFYGPDGRVYCDHECYVRAGAPTTPKTYDDGICLYTDY